MMFSKKIREVLTMMMDFYECGDIDYSMVVKSHIMCICEFTTENGKHVRKHQSIGVVPNCYDYFQTMPDRLCEKYNANKKTIKIYTIGEMVEEGVI